MKGWVGYGPKLSTESEWTRWRKTAKPSKRCREWEERKREKTDGWSEKRETGAAEVVNRSCGTHLFPLLILCDLYHTHRHTHSNTNSGTMCSVNTLEPPHKYAAKNQRQKITTATFSPTVKTKATQISGSFMAISLLIGKRAGPRHRGLHRLVFYIKVH